ncbi:hypothetical protein [Desulfosporosinus youngiae]|uniref:Uncharacterized protein n=1 Tax=Desulfosporosinus youngiae DSM 17734 TaxID=768710 RepID=H5Y360_9FIRM|nr:hypothetical protein [Desulfosporosinus youngiae]EHQ88755.1 hypothetical protein DesyoDRAFT_1626 [Desulfosporosinus youngiae DSM 17734]
MMYIVLKGEERARLEAVCKSLDITLEEWFRTALHESECNVLNRFLEDPEKSKHWKWDKTMCHFVRKTELE